MIDAVDGKHVIQKPKNGGFYYYNYKHTHLAVLLVIAKPSYECLYADVETDGRIIDVWCKE